MLGAVIGDIAGSRFEWHNHRSKEFDLFTEKCFVTDDSIMTLAIAKAVLDCSGDYSNLPARAVEEMQAVGRPYPKCGYGGRFYHWMYDDNPQPYGSFGNGAAMRVSSVSYAGKSIEEVKDLSRKVTEVTHNHPEGIKGAEAVAVAIFLARTGWKMEDIKAYTEKNYYQLNFSLDEIRPAYRFNATCQGSVPQALEAFFESTDFEDAIRNAVSIGGDSDTLAAITGSIAEAYYGVPEKIRTEAVTFLDDRLAAILREFEAKFPPVVKK